MNGFIELKKADGHSLWLRPEDIFGVSEQKNQVCKIYVRGQAEAFLVQNTPNEVFERLEQAGAE